MQITPSRLPLFAEPRSEPLSEPLYQSPSPELAKVNPHQQPPTTRNWLAPVGTSLAFGSAIAYANLRSINRATLLSSFDQCNWFASLYGLSRTTITQLNKIALAPDLVSRVATAAKASVHCTMAAGGFTLLWGLGFYLAHHLPKRTEPSLPLQNNPENLDSIRLVSLLAQIAKPAGLSDELTQALSQQVVLGHWQYNGAFEQFATSDPSLQALLTEAAQTGMSQAALSELEQAVQSQQPSQLIALLPDQNLRRQCQQLLKQRLCQNLCAFAARSVRAQRAATVFEQQHMNRWLEQYRHLTGTEQQIDISHVLASVQTMLHTLADLEVSPLLSIKPAQRLLAKPLPLTKNLEYQFIDSLAQHYNHRLQGIDNVPKHGPAILAYNHSFFTFDMGLPPIRIARQLGRESFMVIDKALMSVPIIGATLQSIRYREGRPADFNQLLMHNQLVGVAPGGTHEALKPVTQANQLKWQRAKGFVRSHLQTGAPLHTVFSPQVDRIRKNQLPQGIDWLQHNIFSRLKLPILPIFFAPMNHKQVSIEHHISPAFEAPPMPTNDFQFQSSQSRNSQFKARVDELHQHISVVSQARLTQLAVTDQEQVPKRKQE